MRAGPVTEQASATERPVRAPAPSSPLLALQRSAGNRAVGRLVSERSLARWIDPTSLLIDAALHMPAYRPNPPWARRGADNPAATSGPYGAAEARTRWLAAWEVLPEALALTTWCPDVLHAYRLYLLAQRGTVGSTDPDSILNRQFAADHPAHAPLEDALEAALRRKLPGLTLPGAGETVTLPLVPTLYDQTEPHRRVRVTYADNRLAGGVLIGGDSDDGRTADSEYGPDRRELSGEIVLRRTAAGSVRARLVLQYDVADALDFLPGNSRLGLGFPYDTLVETLTRLEASGMARDVRIFGRYRRERSFDATVAP